MAKSYRDYGGALLTRREWMRLGAHSRDLAGPEFTTVFHGHLTLTDRPMTFDAMAWVLQDAVLPGSVLSHSSAALIWGIPLPLQLDDGVARLLGREDGERRDGPLPALADDRSLRSGAALPLLHCRIAPGTGAGTIRGVRVHRWEPGPTMTSGRLLVSSPSETLRELATVLPRWDLVAAIDAVLAGKTSCPPTSPEQLREHLATMRGHRGVAELRRALDLARERAWSPGETIMRLIITGAGFPEQSLNLPVQERRGGRQRYLDLVWSAAGCVLEYDGDGHRTKQQWREDEMRRDEIAALGWTVIRATGADLQRPRRILVRLADALGARGIEVPGEARINTYLADLGRSRPSWRIAGAPPPW